MITYLLCHRLCHKLQTVAPLVPLHRMQALLDIPVPQMKHLVQLEPPQGQCVPIGSPLDLITLFQVSFDEDAKDHRGSNVTRDYINNYVCNRLMHVCMYQVIELYDYYCVVRDPRYTRSYSSYLVTHLNSI